MIVVAAMLLASGLYEQAVSRVLAERFAATEYLLIETATGQVIARNWADIDEPIPVGSLTKPFLAAAMPRDREVTCRAGKCWLPRGHGRVRMADAIAHSCNQWFVHTGGLDKDVRMEPLALARDFVRVIENSAVVREGMRRAVTEGTARRLDIGALAKTGTAACSHATRGPGDGLVVALWPETRPRYLLMVRVHGTTGATAAATAGQLLRVVRDGR